MKFFLAKTVFSAAIIALASSVSLANTKTLSIDNNASSVKWFGKKVTGAHNGVIAVKGGTVELAGKDVKGGMIEIDMPTIVNEDLKDASYNKKLVDHLKSDDFFSVAKHPVSTFKITAVAPAKDKKAGTHDITGDLTIKGITKSVTFPATVKIDDKGASAMGKLVVDRTLFDVRYGSGKFFQNLGDKLIDDNFELTLDIKAKN